MSRPVATRAVEDGRRSVVVVGMAAAVCGLSLVDTLFGSGWFVAGPMVIGAALAGWGLGAFTAPRVAGVCAVVMAALLTLANQLHGDDYHWLDDVAFFVVVIGGPALAGAAAVARLRQVRLLTDLRAKAEAHRRAETEAARIEEQNRLEEQAHRQISQRFGAIALRAEGAQRSRSPQDGLAALGEVEIVARGALDELRHVLGSLRAPPVPAPDPDLPGPATADRGRVSPGDLMIAVACGTAMAVELLLVGPTDSPVWAELVAAYAVATPLLWRRSRPILVTAAVGVVGAAMSAWLTPLPTMVTPIAVTLLVAYAIGAWSRPGWWLPGSGVLWGALVILVLVSPDDRDVSIADAFPVLVFATASVILGVITAGWRGRAEQISRVVADVERGRDAAIRMAVARERRSMASSLHDSVAHAMTVVCVQAGAAQRVAETAVVDDALRTIAATARAGLTELRTGLDAMDEACPLDPAGFAALARDVGVEVDVLVPRGLQLSGPNATLLVRVTREALVNVARHAPGSRAVVTVSKRGDTIRVDVCDDAAGSASFAGSTGTGLRRLAAEVALVGGELTWGPTATEGFGVHAQVPISTAAAASTTAAEAM